jgi:hypothetical protein
VRAEPLARLALGGRDLLARHVTGQFGAIPASFLVAPHGREVEPFVRFDQIGLDIAASRVHQAKLEKGIVTAGIRGPFDKLKRAEFQTCHNLLP